MNLLFIIPLSLSFTLMLFVVSLYICRKDIKQSFLNIDKKTWLILLAIIAIAFFLRGFTAPKTHRILYDEDIYQNQALNIARENKSIVCNFQIIGQPCQDYFYNKEPAGYPFLLSLAYRIFPAGDTTAYWFNIAQSTLIVLLLFFLVYLIFQNQQIALWSSFFLSLIPIHILWSPMSSAENSFSLWMIIALIFLFIFRQTKNYPPLFSAIIASALAMQMRPEGVLFLIITIGFFLIYIRPLKLLKETKFILAILLLIVLSTPLAWHMSSVSNDNWGATGPKFSLQYFTNNLLTNVQYFTSNADFPIFFFLLVIAGLIYVWFYDKKTAVFSYLWLFVFFGIFLIFYAGSYYYGADIRFANDIHPQIAIFCGLFAWRITRLKLKNFNWLPYILTSVIVIISIYSLLNFWPKITSIGQEGWDAREAHDFVIASAKNINSNSIISLHNPAILLNENISSATPNFIFDKTKFNQLQNQGIDIYFFYDYWCFSDPWKATCDNILNQYGKTEVAEKTVKNRTYRLFKLTELK